jgi:gliding motility-associated-like protein
MKTRYSYMPYCCAFFIVLVLSCTGAIAQNGQEISLRTTAEQLLNEQLNEANFITEIVAEINTPSSGIEEKSAEALRKLRVAKGVFIQSYASGLTTEADIPSFISRLKTELVEELSKSKKDHSHDHADHGQQKQLNGPCVNMDFETCDFTGWNLFEGDVNTNPYQMINTAATGPNNQHFITTPGTDPIVGIPTTDPNGGGCSVQLGDGTGTGGRASSMTQSFLVSQANAVYTYSYALVLEDPSGHTTGEKPFFKVNMYDQAGNTIPCADYAVISGPPSSGGDPDFVAYAGGFYLPWRTTFAPLNGYIGQNVTIEFIIGDCSQSGHYGYGYIDANCSPLGIIASDTIICGNDNITLSAPPGAASYLWSTGATTEQIVVSTAGQYTVDITPVTGSQCAITLTIDVLGSPGIPTAAFTAAPNPVCVNTPVTFTDNSTATQGAIISNWQWDFGDGIGTSTQQNPTYTYTVPGNYTVELIAITDGGCSDTTTQVITVISISDPTITPAGPFCNYDPVHTFTAVDAGGTWTSSCGACINASTGAFDPAAAGAGNHTVTYTIPGACGATDNTSITVESVTLTNATVVDPLCFGDCNGSITITATGAVDYSIDGGITWQNNGVFTNVCAGNYNAMVRSGIGCLDSQALTLTDPPLLTLTFSAYDAICYGYCDGYAITIPAGGTTPYSYAWSSTPSNNSPTENNLCAGTYDLILTDANGCTEDSIAFVINEPPPFVINAVTTVDELCLNDCTGSIDIDAPGAVNYSIDNGNTFSASNVFQNQCSNTYDIVVEDAVGCSATTQVVLNPANPVNINISSDTIICVGGTADINALASGGTGTFTYSWDNGLPSQTSHTVTPGSTTIYNVFATDGNGCVTPSVPVTVDYHPPLSVNAFTDQVICVGETVNINAIAQGGIGTPYVYNWDQNLGNGDNHNVSPTGTTTYIVTASDACETPDATAQVTITVNPLPVVEFSADNLEGCLPVNTTFSNLTNPIYVGNSCVWDFGDGSATVDDCGTPSHSFTDPGCYDVSLTVTSPEGCVNDTTINNYICVYDYPVADFSFGPQPTTFFQPEITFNNLSTTPSPDYITNYYWDFDGLGTSEDEHPIYAFPNTDAGTYDVCLTVVNDHGCTDDICKVVEIGGEFLIYVPNAFTPDGDGVNDLFFPSGLNLSNTTEFTMYIFNRWGEMIFESHDPTTAWNGTKRGQNVKQDVYVWKINVRNPYNGAKHDFVGHVTLLR